MISVKIGKYRLSATVNGMSADALLSNGAGRVRVAAYMMLTYFTANYFVANCARSGIGVPTHCW